MKKIQFGIIKLSWFKNRELTYMLFFMSINFYINQIIQEGIHINISTSLIFYGIAIVIASFSYIKLFSKRMAVPQILFFALILGTIFYCLLYPTNISLIYTNITDIAYNPVLILFLYCFPIFILTWKIRDIDVLYNTMIKCSRLCLILSIIGYFIFGLLNQYTAVAYMSYSYYILPAVCLCLQNKRNGKADYLDLILSLLGIVVIIVAGSRGAVVCLLIFVAIKIVRERRDIKVVIIALIAAIIVAIVIVNWQSILAFVANILNAKGLYSRNFNALLSGSFSQSQERNIIWKQIANAIKKSPIIGYGLWGERPIIGGFSHNIVLEMLCSFGVIFGVLIIGYVFIAPLKLYFKKTLNDKVKIILLSAIINGLIPLFFSGSYLNSPWFFFMLGIITNSRLKNFEKSSNWNADYQGIYNKKGKRKMRAYLIYDLYFNVKTHTPTVGGIQTYIYDLADILKKKGYEIIILQKGNESSTIEWNGRTIETLQENSNSLKKYKKIIRKYLLTRLRNEDLVVFMTHTLNFKLNHKKVVSIQHGIYWDVPHDKPRASAFVEFIFRNYHSWNDIKLVNMIPNVVAVDYNFLNWYRTQQYYLRTKVTVIPNYSECVSKIEQKQSDRVNIIFARRLEVYRGSRVFTAAAKKLLLERKNCFITIAGTGSDLDYMKSELSRIDGERVKFITYVHGESQEIHSKNDIAVVGSIGSEGTSLSLLEAMGSGCAVIATNIGGMTNIVLDGYNGLLIGATEQELYNALIKLVDDIRLRNSLQRRGYDTVNMAFSKEKWEKKWERIIDELTV